MITIYDALAEVRASYAKEQGRTEQIKNDIRQVDALACKAQPGDRGEPYAVSKSKPDGMPIKIWAFPGTSGYVQNDLQCWTQHPRFTPGEVEYMRSDEVQRILKVSPPGPIEVTAESAELLKSNTITRLQRIAQAAKEVRIAQKRYFAERNQTNLIESKQKEAELDRLIKEWEQS